MSSVPIVAIALTQSLGLSPSKCCFGSWGSTSSKPNFSNPKIIGDQAHIHPVLVVFSLLVGEHFFALAGALLAVPVLSIAQCLFLHFRNITFGDDAPADSFSLRRRATRPRRLSPPPSDFGFDSRRSEHSIQPAVLQLDSHSGVRLACGRRRACIGFHANRSGPGPANR